MPPGTVRKPQRAKDFQTKEKSLSYASGHQEHGSSEQNEGREMSLLNRH